MSRRLSLYSLVARLKTLDRRRGPIAFNPQQEGGGFGLRMKLTDLREIAVKQVSEAVSRIDLTR
jgi:hypothetical protein